MGDKVFSLLLLLLIPLLYSIEILMQFIQYPLVFKEYNYITLDTGFQM